MILHESINHAALGAACLVALALANSYLDHLWAVGSGELIHDPFGGFMMAQNYH